MKKTKIDWADSTWNPVTGCLHGCEYCYARRIAYRFAGGFDFVSHGQYLKEHHAIIHVLDDPGKMNDGRSAVYPFYFEPTFHRYKLDEPKHWKKPRTIFVCSMADLFGEWVPDEWIREVFKACDDAPQHRYLFLTKNPMRLCRMASATEVFLWNVKHQNEGPHPKTKDYCDIPLLPIRDNWWFGSTLDNANARRFQGDSIWNTFTSIEPITEYMDMGIGSFGSDRWTIIGAETGNRKNKVIPKRAWVENILDAAAITGVKVFMKESLREIMGDDFRQEFPWEA